MPETTTEKTIHQWILTIEDHNIRRAILMRATQESLADSADTLYEAMSGAFDWSETKEGFAYWANIADDLCHVESHAQERAELDPDHFNHE